MRIWCLTSLTLFLCSFVALDAASTRIRVDITVTNNPVTGNTLTINSDARTWTNVTGTTTIATNAAGTVNAAATNLYNAIIASPFTGLGITPVSNNVIRLTAEIDQALIPSQAGNWCSFVLTTNPVQRLRTADWPFDSIYYATNRTNQASAFINGLNDYGAAAFGTNCVALSNYVSRGAIEQTSLGIMRWLGTNFFSRVFATNATLVNAVSISGVIGSLTNGYATNLTGENFYITNLFAPGTGSGSVSIGGSGSVSGASGVNATAVGASTSAAGRSSAAFGAFATASGSNTVAIGFGSESQGAIGSTALGQNSQAFADFSIALGVSSVVAVNHTNSVAIGASASTTKTNQIMVGTSTHIVTVPGVFEAAATTNANWRGTNKLAGSLQIPRFDHSSLANGANAGVILGTNHWVRIIAGPTAAFSIAGFANGQDGLCYKVSNYTGYPMTISNQSGTEPTAANRILTGKGADLSVTNYPGAIEIIYDASASRWTLLNYTD